MRTESLFKEHINQQQLEWMDALKHSGCADHAVLVYSGKLHYHFADDHAGTFRAWGHFLRWIPVDRPDFFVLLRAGRQPQFLPVLPNDYWHDQHLDMPEWWASSFDIRPLLSVTDLGKALRDAQVSAERLIFLGEDEKLAASLGCEAHQINPTILLTWLDYQRAYKSDYEVHCLADANALALNGHQAAHESFLAGGDEYDIHMAYLKACRALDSELPYNNIVALNANGAILHYQHKKRFQQTLSQKPANQVLLIDAGCRWHSYCSDITRTWCAPGVHNDFQALLEGMQTLQTAIVDEIRVGSSFVELHKSTHAKLAQLLIDSRLCYGSAEQLLAKGITRAFLPHGLGHLLGLQVHDVGGRLADAHGNFAPPPVEFPTLRTTRAIEERMVFTIEPGLYFIPVLLDALRAGSDSGLLNWQLIEQLQPLGGIRIEDNIWVAPHGVHNLTRRPLAQGS
jgi:Xaa-Pro dipeptidase